MNPRSSSRVSRPEIKPSTKAKQLRGTSSRSKTATALRPLDLTPGFRDRLIESLDRASIPPGARMAYVASLTLRAGQSVSRWLDPQRPGLPDLESCARLCDGLGCSSDWMLGLSPEPVPVASASIVGAPPGIERVNEMFRALRGNSSACDVVRMVGDEMAPSIGDGDLMFIDHGEATLAGNGVYALEFDGRLIVRRVESRLGAGLVVRCDNTRYQDHVLKDAAAVKRVGLRVIGRVLGSLGMTRFWRT